MTEYGAVEGRGVGGAEEMEPSGSAAGVGAGKIRGVGMYAEDHVGGMEDEAVGRVGFGIAEEAVGRGDGLFGGMGLMGG